jgi:hypothetical protein
MGKIYVIKSGAYLKIGFTSGENTSSRLKVLQVGNPVPLSVVFEVSIDEKAMMAKTSEVEAEIHKELAAYRGIGEWFAIGANEAIDKILGVIEGWDSRDRKKSERATYRRYAMVALGKGEYDRLMERCKSQDYMNEFVSSAIRRHLNYKDDAE